MGGSAAGRCPGTPHRGARRPPREADAPVPVGRLRHRAELPLLVAGVILTILAVHGAVVTFALGGEPRPWAGAVIAGLLSPIVAVLVIRVQYWKTVSNGVQATPEQFPELWETYAQVGRRLGFENGPDAPSLPRLYVVNGNGTLNAFASKCRVTRSYVVVSSDLVDVAYEENDFRPVRFILAHELGHIVCGHVNLWRQMVRPILGILLLDPSLSRAQEYTADRVGALVAPEGARGLVVLYAGKRLARRVDHGAYARSIAEHGDPFWLRVVNLASGHAVGFRRYAALARVEREGWDVHGRMG